MSSVDEVAAGYPADLSQVRRDDSRACVLLVLALLLRKELDDRLARKQWKLEWADVVRDLDNLVEMEVAINGKGYVFRGQSSAWRARFFKPAPSPCRHATRMLNPASVRRRWRESVSLRRFQNCNTLIMNHFRNRGVEDESEDRYAKL